MLNGIDVTYNVVNSLIWAIVECSVGIVCVSLPPIRPLVVRVLPSYFKTTVAASRYGGGFSVGGTFAGAAGANSALGGSRRPSAAASVARDGVDDRDDIELQRQGREKDGCGSASPRSCSSDGTDLEKGHADAGICVSPAPGAVLASDRSKIISRQHSLTHHNHHEQKHHHNDAEEAQAGRSSQ